MFIPVQVIPSNDHVTSEAARETEGDKTTAPTGPRRMFEHFQEIDCKDHLGKWYVPPPPALCFCNNLSMYQAFVIETADDGIAVHFSGWSQIWDEFIPKSQLAKRVRSRGVFTETGENGPETVNEVCASLPPLCFCNILCMSVPCTPASHAGNKTLCDCCGRVVFPMPPLSMALERHPKSSALRT